MSRKGIGFALGMVTLALGLAVFTGCATLTESEMAQLDAIKTSVAEFTTKTTAEVQALYGQLDAALVELKDGKIDLAKYNELRLAVLGMVESKSQEVSVMVSSANDQIKAIIQAAKERGSSTLEAILGVLGAFLLGGATMPSKGLPGLLAALKAVFTSKTEPTTTPTPTPPAA